MVASPRSLDLGRFKRVGLVAVAILVILPLLLLGIGRLSRGSDVTTKTGTVSQPYYAPAATAAPARAAGAAPAPVASGSTTSSAAGVPPSTTTDAVGVNVPSTASDDRKVIRTGTMTLTVKDVPGTMNMIWGLASEMDGFVVNSTASGTGTAIRGEITFRVPSERFKDAMDRLRNYAVKVENEKSAAQDVSEEYVDLKARRDNLELTVKQLQTLMAQARTVDEALKVQVQLTNVQSDLERIKGRMNFLDSRAAMSTITASLLPDAALTTQPPTESWSFGHSISHAWDRSLHGLQDLADAIITVLIGGWWLLLPLGIASVFFVRWARHRRPALQPAAAHVTSTPPQDVA